MNYIRLLSIVGAELLVFLCKSFLGLLGERKGSREVYQQAVEEGACSFSLPLPRSEGRNVWTVLLALLAEHKVDKRSCVFWKDNVTKMETFSKSISR